MKLFLDANILVSVLNKEFPVFSFSSKILSLTGRKNVSICTSPLCLAIAFYFACKKTSEEITKKKIEILCNHIEITSIDKNSVFKTFSNKMVGDLEDGLEYYSALEAGCTHLITEDKNDFYFSNIPIMTAQEFLEWYVGQ
ncbi:MAG: twitching motility protein PilT [Bacteroidota bacterium]|nr:twitching motility protein PilT [Bacteroidota bacterium]